MPTTTSGVRTRRARAGIGPWLVLPALVLLAVFVYIPVGRGIQLSLFGSDLLGNPSRFVGLANWGRFFTDPTLVRSIGTSLVIAACATAIAVSIAVMGALLLRERIPGRGVFQVILSLPFAYSAATASAVFAGLFAPSVGVINDMLARIGVDGPPWLQDPGWAVASISLATGWYESGFAFLVMIAAVRNLPDDVLEAASLDGAYGVRLIRSILLPLLWPSIFFLIVTQMISGLQTFAQVFVLTRGGPSDSTRTLVFTLYELAFGGGTANYSQASVVATFLVLLVGAVTAIPFLLSRRKNNA